jgi:hypothetical protein
MARFDYIKRRGGILLLTGDPGVGKTLTLRRYVDTLNENLFKPYYTPLSTLSRADLLYHSNEESGEVWGGRRTFLTRLGRSQPGKGTRRGRSVDWGRIGIGAGVIWEGNWSAE